VAQFNAHGQFVKIMLGAGLEPASLSAYAPQTYVSANSTTRALREGEVSAGGDHWQVSFLWSFTPGRSLLQTDSVQARFPAK
jgi:hypothetical protein